MKNLLLFTILTFGSVSLFAQDNTQTKIDSLTQILSGAWDFVEVVDQNGEKIESIEREMKGSPIGDQIKIKASGPNMILNKDGSYELEFTPKNIDKGNWKLATSDTLIFQLVTEKGSSSYNMLKSAAEMFGKELNYDEDGNIIENNPRVIGKLEANKLLIEYETDYFQVYRKKK